MQWMLKKGLDREEGIMRMHLMFRYVQAMLLQITDSEHQLLTEKTHFKALLCVGCFLGLHLLS